MKMGDFIADIVNLFLLGYLFCLWDKRTEGKKLGIIILVWAGILCIPQQIHIINKSLFAQFVFVWKVVSKSSMVHTDADDYFRIGFPCN